MYEELKGYVTTFASVQNRNRKELEDLLGFSRGALAGGYRLYELKEDVKLGEFEWCDRTLFSGGWNYDRSIKEFVQRQDEVRWKFMVKHDHFAPKADKEFDMFMGAEMAKLNVRSGPERIVKVRRNPALGNPEFPDSKFRDIPQWKLTIKKNFRLVPH
jgi:hypothetical protein